MIKFNLVETEDQLKQAIENIKSSKTLYLDTEFKRKKTFYLELSLIQINDGNQITIIDIKKLKNADELWDIIHDESKLKIFHSLHEDIEAITDRSKKKINNVFDTQIAAAILNIDFMISYSKLVKIITNKDIDKTQCKNDWIKRPLSQKQLRYAAEDVFYLQKIYEELEIKLKEQNKYDWVLEESQRKNEKINHKPSYKDIKGYKKANNKELKYLQRLAQWLVEAAKTNNLPKKKIASSKEILSIAQRKKIPERIKKITPNIQDYLELAKKDEEIKLEINDRKKNNALYQEIEKEIELICKQNNINKKIFCSNKEISNYIEQEIKEDHSSIINQGWRGKICKDKLKKIIDKHHKNNNKNKLN